MRVTELSPRESNVLRLSAWGYSNIEIARTLGIAVKTVESHKFNGMRKLKLPGRVALIRHAVGEGWLAPTEGPESTTTLANPA